MFPSGGGSIFAGLGSIRSLFLDWRPHFSHILGIWWWPEGLVEGSWEENEMGGGELDGGGGGWKDGGAGHRDPASKIL